MDEERKDIKEGEIMSKMKEEDGTKWINQYKLEPSFKRYG